MPMPNNKIKMPDIFATTFFILLFISIQAVKQSMCSRG
jgi:hypothetical protein